MTFFKKHCSRGHRISSKQPWTSGSAWHVFTSSLLPMPSAGASALYWYRYRWRQLSMQRLHAPARITISLKSKWIPSSYVVLKGRSSGPSSPCLSQNGYLYQYSTRPRKRRWRWRWRRRPRRRSRRTIFVWAIIGKSVQQPSHWGTFCCRVHCLSTLVGRYPCWQVLPVPLSSRVILDWIND